MKERPILFSTPMVKAILDGRKTQTRRVIKPVGKDGGFVICEHENGWWPYRSDDGETLFHTVKENGKEYLCETPHSCPFGKIGDRLWIRETYLECSIGTVYRADNILEMDAKFLGGWKPSIFMPQSSSRILLEITKIRVEKLHEITPQDALEEGVEYDRHGYGLGNPCDEIRMINAYQNLWESINGKRSWDLNPFVWVIQFRMV